MSTKRGIVVSGLDATVRSIVNECLPSDHFDITEFDQNEGAAATLRSPGGANVPLFCCAGRYAYPLIRHFLGNAVQRYDHYTV